MTHPIDRIEWRHVDDLDPNDYNPNFVLGPELRLLEHSLLVTGWIQPILCLADGRIIDGFHRYSLARDSRKLRGRDKGRVPCAVVDITRPEAIMLTVRINRAKGSHEALRMSQLVRELLDDHGLSEAEVCAGLGATLDEVRLLHTDGVFKARNLANVKYSQAWVPAEVKR